ncbi:MAG: hypothetical protein AB1512_30760 [Thermodesulfobacteriota bacterium]
MKGNISRLAIPFGMLSLVAVAAGCGTMKSVYDKVSVAKPSVNIVSTKADKSGLKKKVLILPFLNQAGLPEKKYRELTVAFMRLLEKEDRLVLIQSPDPLPSTLKQGASGFGILTDSDMAKKAEEMGCNVLVTVVINAYELRLKRTGIWPLRSTKREVEVSMVVNALDLINGTLFLTELESEKMDFDMEEWDEEEELKVEMPEIDDKTFTRLWTGVVERQVANLRPALRNQIWSGRVLSARNQHIVVSAGRSVGLASGKVFEVFARGEPVRTAGGRSIYLLGPKVGEVKAVEIMEDSAMAVPLTEAAYKAGQVIRVKN